MTDGLTWEDVGESVLRAVVRELGYSMRRQGLGREGLWDKDMHGISRRE